MIPFCWRRAGSRKRLYNGDDEGRVSSGVFKDFFFFLRQAACEISPCDSKGTVLFFCKMASLALRRFNSHFLYIEFTFRSHVSPWGFFFYEICVLISMLDGAFSYINKHECILHIFVVTVFQ